MELSGFAARALITGQQTEGKLAVFEQKMAPNGGVPLHINHREDESFCLTGKPFGVFGGVIARGAR